jgi:hypothetical protein
MFLSKKLGLVCSVQNRKIIFVRACHETRSWTSSFVCAGWLHPSAESFESSNQRRKLLISDTLPSR